MSGGTLRIRSMSIADYAALVDNPELTRSLVRSGDFKETDAYAVPDGEMDDIPDKDFYRARIHKLRNTIWMQGFVAPAYGKSPVSYTHLTLPTKA